MNTLVPTELQEQAEVVRYLEILKMQGKILLYSGIPNNTYTKSWAQKRKQKMEGLQKGFPDLVIVFPNDILFVEMKRIKGGRLQQSQKEWLKNLKNKKTHSAVAKGSGEAVDIIKKFITS